MGNLETSNRQMDDIFFLNNETSVRQLQELISQRNYRNDYFDLFTKHKASGKKYFESILISDMLLNSGLSIVPTKNMCVNIGNLSGSAHFSGDSRYMSKALKKLFSLKCYEIEFPLKHSDYVMENISYIKRVYKIMEWNLTIEEEIKRRIRNLCLKIRYGDTKGITRAILNLIHK